MEKLKSGEINPSKLMREFDKMTRYAQPALDVAFTREDIDQLAKEAHQAFANLIPQLPDIGGKQPFTKFIANTAMWLAIYRVLDAHGKTPDEAGVLLYRISQSILQAYPLIVVKMFGRNIFSQRYQQELQKRAAESQMRQYPDDYVYTYVEGDGVTFDYGVDYLECGGCKFLEKQGAIGIAPYLCPVDILYSELFGWGLTRTMTIAEGAPKCDFRFKKGGPTRVKVPPTMTSVVQEAR